MSQNMILYSCDLNKWSSDTQKATITFNLRTGDENHRSQVDVQLDNFEQSWGKIGRKFKTDLANEDVSENDLVLKDEAVIKQAMIQYFERVRREIGGGRNGKKHGKGGISRYHLFYLREPEIDLLNDDEKFYAYMDIIERKASKDHYNQIGNYIEAALKLKKNSAELMRHQANFLLSNNKTEEALDCLKEYLKTNKDDIEVHTQLAKLYDKLDDFKNADKVYDTIIKMDPENLNAILRKAQILYYSGEDYLPELDKVKEIDSAFLKDFLKKDWDYHLPKAKKDLNPVRAAVYFGHDRAMDIAPHAFNRDIPAYINMKNANVMFSKEEIDNWFKIINKYDLNEYGFELYPEKM
jgi:tetratricopeptide (TPR) repeat protein